MTNTHLLDAVYDAVESETRRIGSALGAYRRTAHTLGPAGDILAEIRKRTSKGHGVLLRRNPHEREPLGEQTATISCGVDEKGMPTAALLAGVRRLTDPIDRMLRREAAILTLTDEHLAEDGFLCPKWSYSTSPLLIAMMKADSYDPQNLVSLRYRQTPTGLVLDRDQGRIMTYGDTAPNGNGTNVRGEVHLDVVDAEVYEHRAGAVTVTYMSGKKHRSRLFIAGSARLPESMLPSLKGRALDDVVRHPAWGGSVPGAIVHEAVNHPDYMKLTLEAALAPLAEAPAGMDTSWRSTIS